MRTEDVLLIYFEQIVSSSFFLRKYKQFLTISPKNILQRDSWLSWQIPRVYALAWYSKRPYYITPGSRDSLKEKFYQNVKKITDISFVMKWEKICMAVTS